MDFRNRFEFGNGMYTVREIADILHLPYYKVSRYINKYWDDRFASMYGNNYSWTTDGVRAVNFHTLIELNTFIKLSEAGVSTKNLLKAHETLVHKSDNPYPLAHKSILDRIKVAGSIIVFQNHPKTITSLDGKDQTFINFISDWYEKIDFENDIATKLYPLGKGNSVVCDPEIQFGSPIIKGTRIFPETIKGSHDAGDSKLFISKTYNLSIKQVNDAIEYCSQAA